jgi:hypothetical protein
MNARELSDVDLIASLRKAASAWFRNDHLLMLEELIRRYQAQRMVWPPQ